MINENANVLTKARTADYNIVNKTVRSLDMTKNLKNNVIKYLLYVLTFGFLFYMMSCCPMINDDFKFFSYMKTDVGDMWRFSLYYGNGRLLGNFLSLLLIHHPLLIAIEKSAVIFLVILMLSKLFSYKCREKEITVYLLSYVAVLAVSPYVLQEVFTWFTCFQNYVVPIAGTLICVYLIRINESKSFRIPSLLLIFVFGFTSQLYLELNTVVNIGFAGLMFLVCVKSDKARLPKIITFGVSSFLGGLTMFLIPRLFVDEERKSHMANYRGVHLDSLEDFRRTFVDNSSLSLYKLETTFIPVLILAVCIFFIVEKSNKKGGIKFFCKLSSVLFPTVNIVFQTLSEMQSGEKKLFYPALFMVSLAMFIVSAAFAASSMEKCFEKKAAGLSLILAVASFLPITVISPYGARCAYLCIFFLTCCAVSLCSYLFKNGTFGGNALLVISVTACVLTLHVGMNYYNIDRMAGERDRYIRAELEKGSTVVEIPGVPSRYMHDSALFMYGSYYYREKQYDTEFKYIDSDERNERINGTSENQG